MFPHSHRHGHDLVLPTQKCLRPDLRSLAMPLNCCSVLLLLSATPEVLAELKRAIYTAICPFILRLFRFKSLVTNQSSSHRWVRSPAFGDLEDQDQIIKKI